MYHFPIDQIPIEKKRYTYYQSSVPNRQENNHTFWRDWGTKAGGLQQETDPYNVHSGQSDKERTHQLNNVRNPAGIQVAIFQPAHTNTSILIQIQPPLEMQLVYK